MWERGQGEGPTHCYPLVFAGWVLRLWSFAFQAWLSSLDWLQPLPFRGESEGRGCKGRAYPRGTRQSNKEHQATRSNAMTYHTVGSARYVQDGLLCVDLALADWRWAFNDDATAWAGLQMQWNRQYCCIEIANMASRSSGEGPWKRISYNFFFFGGGAMCLEISQKEGTY